MADETASFVRGHMMPMDVEGGPTQLAEVEIEAATTGGRPCVLVEQDGTLALLVDGTVRTVRPRWLCEAGSPRS